MHVLFGDDFNLVVWRILYVHITKLTAYILSSSVYALATKRKVYACMLYMCIIINVCMCVYVGVCVRVCVVCVCVCVCVHACVCACVCVCVVHLITLYSIPHFIRDSKEQAQDWKPTEYCVHGFAHSAPRYLSRCKVIVNSNMDSIC